MATRFYLTNTNYTTITPAFNASWDQTGEADRTSMVRKITQSVSDPLTDKTVTIPATTIQQVLARQFISEPLDAQTISGVANCVVRCAEDATTTDCNGAISLRVFSNDGTTVRGTLIGFSSIGGEYGTTPATFVFYTNTAISSVTCQAGDRMVLEIGANVFGGVNTAGTATLRFGDSASSDFAKTNGLTTNLNPWIEFSQDLYFMSSTIGNSQPYLRVGSGQSRNERLK